MLPFQVPYSILNHLFETEFLFRQTCVRVLILYFGREFAQTLSLYFSLYTLHLYACLLVCPCLSIPRPGFLPSFLSPTIKPGRNYVRQIIYGVRWQIIVESDTTGGERFNFEIVNYAYLDSNIQQGGGYGVHMPRTVEFVRPYALCEETACQGYVIKSATLIFLRFSMSIHSSATCRYGQSVKKYLFLTFIAVSDSAELCVRYRILIALN